MPTLQNGRYKASIGYEIKDGKRKPKIFELGRDERLAKRRENVYRDFWDRARHMQPKGQAVWSVHLEVAKSCDRLLDRDLEQAFSIVNGFNALATEKLRIDAPNLNATTLPPAPSKTLYHAITLYEQSISQRREVSDTYRRRALEVMATLRRTREDLPMESIDRLWLDTLAQHFKNCPAKITSRPLQKSCRLRWIALFCGT